jgi:hypothetical protein
MNIEAKLVEKFETQQIKETFQKREFVVEYAENPQYPEYIKFELIQSNCEQIEPFQIGDTINVSFNLKGRKWTDPKGEVKYFNSLQAWRIEKAEGSPASQATAPEDVNQDWQADSFSADDEEGLPF